MISEINMKNLFLLLLLLTAFFYVQKNMSHGQREFLKTEYEDIQYYHSNVHNHEQKKDLCIDQIPYK